MLVERPDHIIFNVPPEVCVGEFILRVICTESRNFLETGVTESKVAKDFGILCEIFFTEARENSQRTLSLGDPPDQPGGVIGSAADPTQGGRESPKLKLRRAHIGQAKGLGESGFFGVRKRLPNLSSLNQPGLGDFSFESCGHLRFVRERKKSGN